MIIVIIIIIIIIITITITIIMKRKKILIPNTYMLDKLCYDMKNKIMSIPSLYFTFSKSLHKYHSLDMPCKLTHPFFTRNFR